MPFGLINAPASFCRLMQLIFKDMLHKQCFVYLDDIIVFASTPEELIKRLDAVFTRLREYGLKAKASKCVLFKTLSGSMCAENKTCFLNKLLYLKEITENNYVHITVQFNI